MSSGEFDPLIDLTYGPVHQSDRFFTMATLVGGCIAELLPCRTKVIARRHHVRLRSVGPAGDDSADERHTEEEGSQYRLMFLHHSLLNSLVVISACWRNRFRPGPRRWPRRRERWPVRDGLPCLPRQPPAPIEPS